MGREESQGERIAVLETEWSEIKDNLKDLNEKLDELLHLKSRGMGAIQLVGLILGSGIIGLVVTVMNLFKSHL